MRLLIDQNISFRLGQKISSFFEEVHHVNELRLNDQSDFAIWKFAALNDYWILTLDRDFIYLSDAFGFPPKVIWLRTSNYSTGKLTARLIDKMPLIHEFEKSPSNTNQSWFELDLNY